MKRIGCFVAVALTAGGCRMLETGYGDNAATRYSADAASSVSSAAKSTVSWAGAKVLSFGADLRPDQHNRFIVMGEHAAAAYKSHPDLPDGYVSLPSDQFAALALPKERYRYDQETGFIEDSSGAGFGARLSMRKDGAEVVVAFRGSNAPGEDEHWMRDWIVNSHQGGVELPHNMSAARKCSLPFAARSLTATSRLQDTLWEAE